MKIRCSGEIYPDPIESDECLQCAIKMKGKQPCGYGYRLLKSIFTSGFEDRSNEIHVTDLSRCLLMSYMQKKDPQPAYVHELLVLWIGLAIHKAMEVSDDYVTSEVPGETDGIMFRLDSVSEVGIEDTKTTRWMKPSKLPYGSHSAQINSYRILSGNGKGMQIQYIDLTGPSKCRKCGIYMRLIEGQYACPICGKTIEDGHLGAVIKEAERVEETRDIMYDRKEQLEYALTLNQPPEPEPGWGCSYCTYTDCLFHPLQK